MTVSGQSDAVADALRAELESAAGAVRADVEAATTGLRADFEAASDGMRAELEAAAGRIEQLTASLEDLAERSDVEPGEHAADREFVERVAAAEQAANAAVEAIGTTSAKLGERLAAIENLVSPDRLSALGKRVDAAEHAAAAAAEAVGAAAENLVERVAAAEQAAAAVDSEHVGELTERVAALEAGSAEAGLDPEAVAAAQEAAEAANVRADELQEGVNAAAADAAAALEGERELRERLDELASKLEESTPAVSTDEDLRGEVAELTQRLQELKTGFDEARQAAVAARREAEQARKAAEKVGKGGSPVGDSVRELLGGLAAARGADVGNGEYVVRKPLGADALAAAAKRPDKPTRKPRKGFDDAPDPLAVIELSGRFKELNAGFAKLVGYQEHEFGKAMWPSVHDRSVYKEQLEQLAKMAAGELESVRIESTYMHGQGLMVPVVGELSLVRGDDGKPSHLLLRAEERHASL